MLGEKHPDVVELSPTGTVPVLVDGEVAIWESAVCIDYLDGRYGEGRLIPSDSVAAARVRLLQVYSDKVVGACLKDLVFEKRSKPRQAWDAELLRNAGEKWSACKDWLESQLDADDYFGGGFSAADCALAARFGVASAYGAPVTSDHPRLSAWYARVTARDSWSKAYPDSFIRAA